MSPLVYPLLLLSLLLATPVAGQPDCGLPSSVPSLLPNASLERFDPDQVGCLSQQPGGLPDATNQANCLTGWQRASLGTTDAWNAFTLPGAPPLFPARLPQPLPSGTGLAGFWVGIKDEQQRINGDGTEARVYREYLAACLVGGRRLAPRQAYRMTFSLGFTSLVRDEEFNIELGSPSPVTLAVYGIRECEQLYFGDFWDCPADANAPGWELIEEITVSGQPERWSSVDFSFTAAADYAGIAIGGSCGSEPGAGREGYRNYYFIDEIRLNVPEVFDQPVAGPVAVSGQTICADRVTLTGTETAGATYQWYKDGQPLTGAVGRILDLPTGPDVDGRYQLQVTTAAGCALTEEVVIQRPVIVDQFADSVALCKPGDTVRIFSTSFNFSNQYTWSDGSTENFLAVVEPGEYGVTISNACEQRTENFVVVAGGEPTYRLVTEPDSPCPGDTVTLAVVSDWYLPFVNFNLPEEAVLSTRQAEARFIAQPDSTLIGVGIASTCSFTEDSLVLRSARIPFTASVPTLSCETPTGKIQLTVTDGGAVEYSWTGPAGAPLGDSSPELMVTTPGTYRVELVDGVRCPTVDSFTVNFSGTFATGLVVGDATCGTDGTAAVTPGGGSAPYRVEWFELGSTTAIASQQNVIDSLAPAPYEVVVTDATGCELRELFTVGAADSLTLRARVAFADCEDATFGQIVLTATGGRAPYRYVLNDLTQPSPVFDRVAAGEYSFTVTDANDCTSEPVTATVTLPTSFELMLPAEITVAQGDSVALPLSIDGLAFTDGTLSWSPADGLSCTDCPNPVARPIVTTRYVATFTSGEGCSETAAVVVNVDGRLRFFAPTAFSPNGDGNNDGWRVFLGPSVVALAELRVYDRWGELVWENTTGDPAEGWDGTFRGQLLRSAAFVYAGVLVLVDGRTEQVGGSVTLLR